MREALAELELPYELVSCGKGSRHRRALLCKPQGVLVMQLAGVQGGVSRVSGAAGCMCRREVSLPMSSMWVA